MSGILWIFLALLLFVAVLEPGLLANVPGYVVAIWIGLPLVAGFILIRVAIIQSRKQSFASDVDEKEKGY